MNKFHFEVGKKYSRKDVYRIVNVPEERQGGNWDTGYNRYNNDLYIFANINTSGRTGHDYNNRFIGDNLEWFAKNGSKIKHNSIKQMINPTGKIFIFVRENSKNPNFFYLGNGRVLKYFDETPVRIIWSFFDTEENHPELLAEKTTGDSPLVEGSKKQIFVNAYERNPIAREKCLKHYGFNCCVCEFNFKEKYGEIGEDFIHVHHLQEISQIGKEYVIDPIRDLRPVCPNCHAMLHIKKPAFTIKQLKVQISNRRK
jgi:5-methylcytosine-specific restriction enzyme A